MQIELRRRQGPSLFAEVDPEDFDRVSAHRWSAARDGQTYYALRRLTLARDGRNSTESMHVFILGARGIDHIDGNGLNNTRANLRRANQHQNGGNRRPQAGRAWKGVSRVGSRWRAGIEVRGLRINLGTHSSPEQAARAYDLAAQEHFGEFARLNFAKETP